VESGHISPYYNETLLIAYRYESFKHVFLFVIIWDRDTGKPGLNIYQHTKLNFIWLSLSSKCAVVSQISSNSDP